MSVRFKNARVEKMPLNIRIFRDAEMTMKIIFERSSQKGGRQGARKEGQEGTRIFIVVAFSQEKQ